MRTQLRDEASYVGRYIIAGVLGNGLVLLVYYFLTLYLSIAPRLAFTLACIIIFPVAFFLSRNWSFRSNALILKSMISFSLGYICSFLLQWGILHSGLVMGFSHIFLVPLSQFIAACFFYSLQRYVIFSRSKL